MFVLVDIVSYAKLMAQIFLPSHLMGCIDLSDNPD